MSYDVDNITDVSAILSGDDWEKYAGDAPRLRISDLDRVSFDRVYMKLNKKYDLQITATDGGIAIRIFKVKSDDTILTWESTE